MCALGNFVSGHQTFLSCYVVSLARRWILSLKLYLSLKRGHISNFIIGLLYLKPRCACLDCTCRLWVSMLKHISGWETLMLWHPAIRRLIDRFEVLAKFSFSLDAFNIMQISSVLVKVFGSDSNLIKPIFWIMLPLRIDHADAFILPVFAHASKSLFHFGCNRVLAKCSVSFKDKSLMLRCRGYNIIAHNAWLIVKGQFPMNFICRGILLWCLGGHLLLLSNQSHFPSDSVCDSSCNSNGRCRGRLWKKRWCPSNDWVVVLQLLFFLFVQVFHFGVCCHVASLNARSYGLVCCLALFKSRWRHTTRWRISLLYWICDSILAKFYGLSFQRCHFGIFDQILLTSRGSMWPEQLYTLGHRVSLDEICFLCWVRHSWIIDERALIGSRLHCLISYMFLVVIISWIWLLFGLHRVIKHIIFWTICSRRINEVAFFSTWRLFPLCGWNRVSTRWGEHIRVCLRVRVP